MAADLKEKYAEERHTQFMWRFYDCDADAGVELPVCFAKTADAARQLLAYIDVLERQAFDRGKARGRTELGNDLRRLIGAASEEWAGNQIERLDNEKEDRK